MNRLLTTASIIALAATASAAHAATWPNWYLGLGGGVAFLGDTDLRGSTNSKASYDTGGFGVVSLGFMPYDSMNMGGMRFEIEGGYHINSLDRVAGVSNRSGTLRTWSYMGNMYYDFRNATGWTPYIGAGAGGASVTLGKNSSLGNTGNADNTYAYQLMAGLSYAPTSLPMTEWNIGYRYFVANSPEFRTATGKLKLDDLQTHNVEVGAKFRF